MAKVTDVRLEKKQILVDNFRKKGLPELLSEVSFSIDTTEDSKTLLKKFLSAVKRKFKNEYLSLDSIKKQHYFDEVRIHDVYCVKVEPLKTDDPKFFDYMNRLVKQTSTLDKTKNTPDLVKVTIQNGTEEYLGYSLLNGEIKSNYHRTERAFTSNKKYGYLLLLDLPSLLAETIVVQSLAKFYVENPELVKYLFVKQYLYETRGGSIAPTTDEPDYLKDFIDVAMSHQMVNILKAKESSVVNKNKPLFYGERRDTYGNKWGFLKDETLQLVVSEFIKQTEYAQYKSKEEFDERSDYAKAFQTKKAIKLSHQEKMKNNVFLTRYGMVELDNDVDLKKFKVIEENFSQLNQHIFIPMRKDYSFRIKKLGKHRAAGIFFPYFKTTIFDLNHPDSYVHEFFHQIDYMLAEGTRYDCYSESMAFRFIYDQYKDLMIKHVDSLSSTHPFRVQWVGKTKYNKAYFLKPTEVFARSGEIYISQKIKEENSLFKTEEDLKKDNVYPFEESFVRAVIQFFDELWAKVKETTDVQVETAAKNATRRIKTTHVAEKAEPYPQHIEQLSLF